MVADNVLPTTMKAVVVQEGKKVAVKDHPVPSIGDDDILVKVVAVAQNPADWRFVDAVQNVGTVIGCDWSGHVVQRGKNVTTPDLGAHVSGFVMGGTFVDSGAYAEYVKTPAELAWTVPEGTLSHEQAATVSAGLFTAAQCLYHPQRLALVEPPEKVEGVDWILIYGGSSSVGQYAIQLAHLSGYKVITTASPRNFDLVKSLGADTAFDYKDPGVVEAIKSATGDSLRHAIDTQSIKETQEICARAMGPQGGKLVLMFPPTFKAKKLRKDVEFISTMIYTALGRPFSLGPQAKFAAQPKDRAQIANFMLKTPQLVRDGLIVPNRVKLWEGGLQAIPEGLQYMREGKVSGEKVVYRV
ncbi:GroES-like protein [Fomitopsis serialis]|uniref:GroES-like protein n=1 Tax=Fomitopsis serialis TaxID=139415 RepID=UPI0020089BAF|nr:GroES-like protein [Neoantrodia serialis]KAH9934267.1 GroES-like protein [Neoantrodia serialis]